MLEEAEIEILKIEEKLDEIRRQKRMIDILTGEKEKPFLLSA